VNHTGDPVFDLTCAKALAGKLSQSPSRDRARDRARDAAE